MTVENDQKPIAIIGGGLAGTTTLVQTLIKIAEDPGITTPVKIAMVERHPEQMHGGVAYSKGATFKNHNLNGGARTFSMFPVGLPMPEGFPSFPEYIHDLAKQNPDAIDCLTNPPRQLVSDYMQHVVGIALKKAEGKATVEFAMKNASDLEETENGATISFTDGSTLDASHVVMATGFQENLTPRFAQDVAGNPRFAGQPYHSSANRVFEAACAEDGHKDCKVLIIGTGLTAMDIATRLIRSGFKGEITMMSRRALMHKTFEPTSPQEYMETGSLRGEPRPLPQLEFTHHRPKFMKARTVGGLARGIAKEFQDLRQKGYSSMEILGYWERFTPEIAEKFPKKDLAALLNAHEALITSNRVGVTPDTGVTIRDGIASGQIKIKSGSIKHVGGGHDCIECTYNPGTSALSLVKNQFGAAHNRTETEEFDFAFSAMGNTSLYDPSLHAIRNPVWASLVEQGKAVAHWTKSGVTVDRDFSLVDRDGNPSKVITTLGVPVAGHMTVTSYPYPDKPGIAGGKLGAAALSATIIANEAMFFLDARYDDLVKPYRDATPTGGVKHAPKKVQHGM